MHPNIAQRTQWIVWRPSATRLTKGSRCDGEVGAGPLSDAKHGLAAALSEYPSLRQN